MDPETIIKTENLTRHFAVDKGKKIVALDNLNLEVKKGEIFGLLGPNGAGKTTCIKLLSTLLYPTSGTAYINGFDIRKQEEKVRGILGVVFGKRMIYHRLTGRDNLNFYGSIYNVPNLKKRIEELAKFFGFERLDSLVETYSSGMRQQLALMRGLIHDPPILFLDEPTLGLDPNISLKIRWKIKKLREEEKTIILTTHYMVEAEEMCDRIGILNQGKLVAIDTPQGLRRKIPQKNHLDIEFEKPKIAQKAGKEITLTIKTTPIRIKGSIIRLPIRDSKDLTSTLKDIANLNIPIVNIQFKEPSLETVFSYYTAYKE